jgi:type II secretory pathway pseudopilin PulG
VPPRLSFNPSAEPPRRRGPLRSAANAACVVAVIGLVAVITSAGSRALREAAAVDAARSALRRFQQVIAVHSASNQTPLTAEGWPTTLDPAWFRRDASGPGGVPSNPLLTPDRPWVELATPDQAALTNPPERLALTRDLAAFWYNPARGIVRARVPLKGSEQASVALYNRINATYITVAFEPFLPDTPPAADPQPPADADPGLPLDGARTTEATEPLP